MRGSVLGCCLLVGRGAGTVLFAASAMSALVSLHAREPAREGERLEFEVATFRPNPSTERPIVGQTVRVQGGPEGARRIVAIHVTARELIRYAYDYQFRPVALVTGGLGWLDSERWDLVAQAEDPFQPIPRPGMLPPDAVTMLRSLLADRMQLRVRTEERDRSVYELVLERPGDGPGPNLTPPTGKCQGSLSPQDPELGLPRCPFVLGAHPSGQGARFEMGNISMADLATMLGTFPEIDDLVVDRTGLDGRYDMRLHYQGGVILSANAPPVARPVEATELRPLTGAIREQLGVRLQRTRAPVEVLVIERVERPSEN